jgi:hypothetical protein
MEKSVEIAKKVPANALVGDADPFPFTTSALTRVPDNKKTRPVVENRRAAVVEKKVTRRITVSGLTHHHGSDPGPPGF